MFGQPLPQEKKKKNKLNPPPFSFAKPFYKTVFKKIQKVIRADFVIFP